MIMKLMRPDLTKDAIPKSLTAKLGKNQAGE